MLGFTVPHEFLIQHGSIACASCCSFCLVAWFTQRKGNETKVCITSDVCMSVRTARSGRESSARMPANARASDWISAFDRALTWSKLHQDGATKVVHH